MSSVEDPKHLKTAIVMEQLALGRWVCAGVVRGDEYVLKACIGLAKISSLTSYGKTQTNFLANPIFSNEGRRC